LVGNHERAIYASTGTRKREQMMYAKRIKQYGNKDNAKSRCESDRYHLLNLTHLTRGKNRIEFRAFGGTLNKTKVVGYLMMVLGLVELALNTKRCSEWDYIKKEGTKSCWDRPGAGLGETGMEEDQNQTPRARPQIRPRGLNHNHIERRERNRGVLPLGRDTRPLSRSSLHLRPSTQHSKHRNTGEPCEPWRVPRNMEKHSEKQLESA
jgi:hypothetical protein